MKLGDDDHQTSIRKIAICFLLVGPAEENAEQKVMAGIFYVIDETIEKDYALNFEKCAFAAIGETILLTPLNRPLPMPSVRTL